MVIMLQAAEGNAVSNVDPTDKENNKRKRCIFLLASMLKKLKITAKFKLKMDRK